MKTLEQQVLRLQLIEPVGVDDEDGVVDEVTDSRADNQSFPPMKI